MKIIIVAASWLQKNAPRMALRSPALCLALGGESQELTGLARRAGVG